MAFGMEIDLTDRTHPDSGRIITSGDILLHDAKTALMYAQQPDDCGNTPYDEGPFTLAQQPVTVYADLMQAASDWICEHVENGTPGVMIWAIRLQSAAQKLRASHWQAPAQAAPAAVAVPVKLPFAIMDDELEALRRFDECARDFEAGGHDVRKEMMKRLAGIGLVRRVTANIYEHTTFGLSVLNGDFDAAPTTQPAAQQEVQEPVAWYVTGGSRLLDEDEAKAEVRRIGGTARAMPLYTAPQPSLAAQGDALDAARYRFLRDGEWRDTDLEPFIRLQLNTLWDAKIDAARAAQEGK